MSFEIAGGKMATDKAKRDVGSVGESPAPASFSEMANDADYQREAIELAERVAAPPEPTTCWHKEIDDDGICKACGAKAAINLPLTPEEVRTARLQQDRESLDMLRRVSGEGEAAKRELSDARYEMSQCDDIALDRPLADCINQLQRARERAERVAPAESCWHETGLKEGVYEGTYQDWVDRAHGAEAKVSTLKQALEAMIVLCEMREFPAAVTLQRYKALIKSGESRQ